MLLENDQLTGLHFLDAQSEDYKKCNSAKKNNKKKKSIMAFNSYMHLRITLIRK